MKNKYLNINCKKHLSNINIKDGDIISFISLQWIESNYVNREISMLLYPVIKCDFNSNDKIIEYNLEHISSISENIKSENMDWMIKEYGLKIERLRNIANNRLKGIPSGIRKKFKVTRKVVEFFQNKEYLDYKIIETFEF